VGSTSNLTTRIGGALARAIRRNAARMAADLPAAIRGDRDATHDVRVASRRLRAALPIVGRAAGVDVRGLSREARRVTRALAGVREADVVREVLQAWPRDDGRMPAAIAHVDARCAAVAARRRRAVRAALAKTNVVELASGLRELSRRLVSASDDAGRAAAFVAEARRRGRALAEAVDEAGIVYAVDPLHRVRIAAKKLRYVLEIGSPALPAVGARATRRLRRLQSRLGRLHDLQMAQQCVREAAAERLATPALGAELARLDRALEVECRRAHAEALRTRAGIETMLREVERAAAALLVAPAVGRMARMRIAAHGRGAAAR
jgi:CHAD domain-containing protein